jgi:hypothetical protein
VTTQGTQAAEREKEKARIAGLNRYIAGKEKARIAGL